MELTVSQWKKADSFLGKRKREDDENLPEEETKKKQVLGNLKKSTEETSSEDDEKENDETADNTQVDVFPPGEKNPWYLGKKEDAFYLRSCVEDVLSMIMDDKILSQPADSLLCVISGASGIGKSWSINAFMTELLHANKNVFFHSGASGRAWKISCGDNNGDNDLLVEPCAPANIQVLESDWIYVYDSPGSNKGSGTIDGWSETAQHRNGKGMVSLLFSSPKANNYDFAIKKSNIPGIILNLPTWKKEGMLKVANNSEALSTNSDAVDACYSIWGGNMRALDKFLFLCKQTSPAEAKVTAEKELNTQVGLIDKEFVRKMSKKLEKQHVERQFTGQDVQDSPGHILTPEPLIVDRHVKDCFQEFMWRFCSPLAESKFWERVKELGDDDILKDLLLSVFQTPSPKGVLFEKVVHMLITNGLVDKFRCYPYNERDKVSEIAITQCHNKVRKFESETELRMMFTNAITELGSKAGAIALEPKSDSFDAVDMFVLEKREGGAIKITGDWSLYLLQDTISKKHSLHPVKVFWYCSLFCDAFEKIYTNENQDDVLKCCQYIPIVPQDEKTFSFKGETSSSNWAELERVATLLNFQWPGALIEQSPDLESVVQQNALEIPPLASGKKRKLSKSVVGNALLLGTAKEKVQEECQVIFDVVRTWEKS